MDDSDIFSDEPLVTQARAGAKFQPKTKRKEKDKNSGSIPSKAPDVGNEEAAKLLSSGLDAAHVIDQCRSSGVTNPSQVATADSLLADDAVPNACDDLHSSFGRSVGESADIFSDLECIDPFLTQSSNNNASIQIDDERMGTQEAGSFPDVDTDDILSDMTILSGQRAGKFKPKPRLQTSVVSSQPAVADSVTHPPNSQFVPSETMCGESSIPDFPPGEVPNCSPINLGAFIPPDPSTSEFLANEELPNLAEASKTGVALPRDPSGVTEKVSSNITQRKAFPVSNPAQTSKQSSTGAEENENGKKRKQLRKEMTSPQVVHDPEEGTCNGDDPAVEFPSNSARDEDKDDDDNGSDEYNVESASPKRRSSRRSKKPVAEKEKPPQKHKNANEKKAQKQKETKEASDQPAKEQPKRFSHSTRRKRKFVDETLLQTPEDEIDFAKVALKDIILLADYKERLAKKEAKELKSSSTNQSNNNTMQEEYAHNEKSSHASEHDQGYKDDQTSIRAQSSSFCLNYQSFMDKEPRARWSKPDTELFYGAIRQFGPDFSLIQQLFPGRSRHQIKLKFKNEERRYPLRLSEALASRAKDHSYFEKVIEQLQQASEAEQQSNGDVSVDLTHEEEVTPETTGEVTKPDQDEDVAGRDQEADVTEDHNGPVAKFVFEAKWPALNDKWLEFPAEAIDFWGKVLELRTEVNKVLEVALTEKLIGSSLEAKVYLHTSDVSLASRLLEMCPASNDADNLRRIFSTSQVEVVPSLGNELVETIQHSGEYLVGEDRFWIGVSRAEGSKCERCWNYSTQVGSFVEHPTLCSRCFNVVAETQLMPTMEAVTI
ncbi:hypothetical protein CCACVL1_11793 [Corchorus capsularis]|uniref:SANT domain-containing protein n=1 Tax=Corchorus capsularis TaxID=210143 RepID=A0A1R3IJI0_COCAP|nr:hypothetical protein CCACVL1_11793 [Corchorus capsularis]